MKRSRIGWISTVTVLALAACSVSLPDDPLEPTNQAGASTGGSAGTAAGGLSSAGATVTAGGANSSAGTPATAGAPSAGTPAVGGGAGSTTAGSGGVSTGGTASGGGGAGGGNLAVKPSAGCARASAQVTIPSSLSSVPTGYNGKDPVPVVIAFHAAGNDNTSIQNAFKSSDLAKKYLMVYPNSTSATSTKNGWNIQADKARYLEVQAAILSQACVDENRIYATGHSSGAQFVVALLCDGAGDFDAVAPVASSVYCQKWKNGAVPSLIIHGVQDEERTKYNLNDGDGKKDLQPYLTSNMCQMTTTPFTPDVSSCKNISGIDGKAFSPGCVEFSGCSVKTRWCNHNDPQYGTSNHGIPCFGVRAIYDFFESL